MLNSLTNAMHAVALAIYSYLTWRGFSDGKPFYNIWIFLSFLSVLILKIFGIIVHLPSIARDRTAHNIFWTIIAILVVALNAITLRAIQAGNPVIIFGTLFTGALSFLFIQSLMRTGGDFRFIAISLSLIHLLCTLLTEDILRLAWFMLFLCNVLWIILSRIYFLRRHKFHNDIYHLTLIAGTFFLYTTIPSGLWGK